MNNTFTNEFAEAEAIINRSIRCPDIAAIAIVLAWLSWSRRPDVGIAAHVRYGMMQARTGRDLPGVQDSKFRDAMGRCTQGAAMEGLRDSRPGPLQTLIDRERYSRVLEDAGERDRILIEMFESGAKNKDVADALGLSPGRVTQIRQKLMESDE